MSRKMKILIIIVIILIVIATAYLIMLLNTNQIIRDVKAIMNSTIPKELTEGLPVDMYNRQGVSDLGAVSHYVEIDRVLVLHNFFSGYMWVRYTCEGFDIYGNRVHGSWQIPALWQIKRIDGKWEIVEIFEDP